MKGFVDVESRVGEGTTVSLYLPLAHGRAKRDSLVVEMGEVPRGTETILVVEDETPIRRVAVRALERSGYTVLAAADGAEGLDLFRKRHSEIALVIADLMMPKMSGTQMFKLIRQDFSDAKFIFTSGYPAQDNRTNVSLDPTIPYLIKPWTLSEMLSLVRGVLDEAQGT